MKNHSSWLGLWNAVRLQAEGSDWKRDEGELLSEWAVEKIKLADDLRKEVVKLRAQLAQATSVLAGQDNTRPEVMVQECRKVLHEGTGLIVRAFRFKE